MADDEAQGGWPVESTALVTQLRTWVEAMATATDVAFPTQTSGRIIAGPPGLRQRAKRPTPRALKALEQLIAARSEPVTLLDGRPDTETWLEWPRTFGLRSGRDARIDDARARSIATTCGYGCTLGPSQTAHARGPCDRRQLAWLELRHSTEDNLAAAITTLLQASHPFVRPRFWGVGTSASADGLTWEIDAQNRLAEYHLRYGGDGGIGSSHVADTAMARFRHVIPCGVWEAVYLLDGLLTNTSDIQPATLPADIQGQNPPVFGLAHLLGLQRMPRIRHGTAWTLFRPSRTAHDQPLESRFGDPIDWPLIHTHLPEMLRVVLSIQAGRITAATILRRLGHDSRTHRLSPAVRAWGRVVRTVFFPAVSARCGTSPDHAGGDQHKCGLHSLCPMAVLWR